MFSGLRPYELAPIDRGCVNTIVFTTSEKLNGDSPEVPVSKTNNILYLTAKTQAWDMDADDSDAVFKVQGTVPNPTEEPERVVFTLSETQSYLDPTVVYYYDIVQTDINGENASRLAIGTFNVTPGPNNAQAGGE